MAYLENTNSCGCEDNQCGCKISSDSIAYQGPNLGCTGINTCDTITAAISKLDQYACSIDMVQNIIYNITNNISLYNQFVTIVNQTVECSTIFTCIDATTTSTTTICPCADPSLFSYDVIVDQTELDLSVNNTVYVEFFNCDDVLQTLGFSVAGTVTNAFCGNNDKLIKEYYLDGDYNRVLTFAQPGKQDGCCV